MNDTRREIQKRRDSLAAKFAVGASAVVISVGTLMQLNNNDAKAIDVDPQYHLAPNGIGMTTMYGDGCAYSEIKNLWGTDKILFEYAGSENAEKVIEWCAEHNITSVDYAVFTDNKNAEEILGEIDVKYMMLAPVTVNDYMFLSQANEAGVIYNSDNHLFINGLTIDRNGDRIECTYGNAAFAIMADNDYLYEKFQEEYVILSGDTKAIDRQDQKCTILNPCAGEIVLDTDGSKFNITKNGQTLDVLNIENVELEEER